jgi:hypothetical protein
LRDDPTPAVANLLVIIDEVIGFQVSAPGANEELLET